MTTLVGSECQHVVYGLIVEGVRLSGKYSFRLTYMYMSVCIHICTCMTTSPCFNLARTFKSQDCSWGSEPGSFCGYEF